MSTIKWFGPQVVAETKLIAGNRLDKAGFVVERAAKGNVPVDTGRLRSSIESRRTGLISQIGTNVKYSLPVELGSTKSAAQPYLRPALIGALPTIRKIFG